MNINFLQKTTGIFIDTVFSEQKNLSVEDISLIMEKINRDMFHLDNVTYQKANKLKTVLESRLSYKEKTKEQDLKSEYDLISESYERVLEACKTKSCEKKEDKKDKTKKTEEKKPLKKDDKKKKKKVVKEDVNSVYSNPNDERMGKYNDFTEEIANELTETFADAFADFQLKHKLDRLEFVKLVKYWMLNKL